MQKTRAAGHEQPKGRRGVTKPRRGPGCHAARSDHGGVDEAEADGGTGEAGDVVDALSFCMMWAAVDVGGVRVLISSLASDFLGGVAFGDELQDFALRGTGKGFPSYLGFRRHEKLGLCA